MKGKGNGNGSLAALAPALVGWYRLHGRRLPWRESRDPYRIWVSEIMLQQTRVETVLRYYEPFLERFPTVAALAAADEGAVAAAWSGLGFYRRARQLHLAARLVLERHGGAVPRRAEELGKLPGIGRYTLGAILSAAWDDPLPILDGNVGRVLCRVCRVPGDPRSSATRRRLWELAEALLPRRGAGEVNQALMDLGATVCTPREPACARCPLQGLCAAHAVGEERAFPAPGRRPTVLAVKRVALLCEREDGALLLVQRPAVGLLASLWELPAAELASGQDAAVLALELARGLGLTRVPERCGRTEHRFSHRHWSIEVFRVAVGALEISQPASRCRWVAPGELHTLGVPTATRKMLAAAGRG